MALGFLFLIEAFDLRIKPNRKVGGHHKRPGQILVAVFGIAASCNSNGRPLNISPTPNAGYLLGRTRRTATASWRTL
jgi:hypothetical protein